jgi:hypothetical protein
MKTSTERRIIMNKKEMVHIAEKIEQSIPELRLAYERCLPTFTPKHNGFKSNLWITLQRSVENIKGYANGRHYNKGEWYFDALDLVNALTLIEMMKSDEETKRIIEELCRVLCEEYDEAVPH